MGSSSASPDDSRGIRNTFHTLRSRMIAAFDRQYVSAALDTNVYGSAMVLSLWVGLLLFAAIAELLPGDSAPMMVLSASHVNDKFLHFSAYAAVAFVPVFGLRLSTAMTCVIATEVVGIGLDLAQFFVRQRSCDPYDVAANTAGILVGIGVAVIGRSRVVRAGQTFRDE
jgi:VanZ family protein